MTLPWHWSIPAGVLPYATLDEMIDTCTAAGITAIEGQTRAFRPLGEQTGYDTIAHSLQGAGVRVSTFHLPFSATVDLAAFYETDRLAAVDETIRWIEISAQFDCRLGITHPTTSRFNVENEGVDHFFDQLSRSVDDLMPVLREHDYRIAIENMPPAEGGARFGSRPEHFQQMAARFDAAHVGFCLDTGHALMCAPPEAVDDYMQAMGDRLLTYHLADNPGDRDLHLAPGRGLVDWARVFSHMECVGYTGHACVETPPFAPGREYSADAWRNHLEQTTALALSALGAGASQA